MALSKNVICYIFLLTVCKGTSGIAKSLLPKFVYDGVIVQSNRYAVPHSYGPSHLFCNGKHQLWWCDWDEMLWGRDAIWYSEKTTPLNEPTKWSRPRMVHNKFNTTWAPNHTADPTVAAGDFSYNEKKYKYALYFTADNGNGTLGNVIGLSFSKDGIVFEPGPDGPVITPDEKPSGYAAGMSGVVWDPLEKKYVQAVFDSTVGDQIVLKHSIDGIAWGPVPGQSTLLDEAGRNAKGQGPDIAYNPQDHYWYAAVKSYDDKGEYDAEVRVLRSKKMDDLLGNWTLLKIIDSKCTNNRGNHNPGLGKNTDGSLYLDSDGYMYIFFGTGSGWEGDAIMYIGQARLLIGDQSR